MSSFLFLKTRGTEHKRVWLGGKLIYSFVVVLFCVCVCVSVFVCVFVFFLRDR